MTDVQRDLEEFAVRYVSLWNEPDADARSKLIVSRLLDHVITFNWKMTDAKTGEAVGGGVDVIELDEEGKIQVGDQFIER